MTRHDAGMPAMPDAANGPVEHARHAPAPGQTPAAPAHVPLAAVRFADCAGTRRRAMPK